MNIWVDATELYLSLRCDFSHPCSLSSCVFTSTPRRILWGWNNSLSNIPTLLPRALDCLLHSFPHSSLSLSLSPPGQKKNSLHGGGGLSVRLKNLWVESVPLNTAFPSSPFPSRFTWLVKQQSSKKGRRKRRCILSLPLAVSQCVPGVSCGLFLMTG